MGKSVSSPTIVSVTTRKKKGKCRQGSPEGTAVLPLFILLETEAVENNVLSLSVTPFPPLYETLRYNPLFQGVRYLDIYIMLQGKRSAVSFQESQTLLFLVVEPTRLKHW